MIGAQLGSAFHSTFMAADRRVEALGTSIRNLASTSSRIDEFKLLKRETLLAKKDWREAELNLRRLGDVMGWVKKPGKELRDAFKQARREAAQAKLAYQSNASGLHEMGKALRAVGVDARNLTSEHKKLGQALTSLKTSQARLESIEALKSANKARRADFRAQMLDAAALSGTLYKAVKPAVEFEHAMAAVGAITWDLAGSENFGKLKDQARELGRTTMYSAAKSAEAMKFLAMTGFDTGQILAATPATLSLAAAGNLDLGRTADIASNILTGFNLKAEKTGHVADVLAQTMRTTNVDVNMLGDTMKYVAPAAAIAGGTLEETAALAGVLGDAGIQGSMSGTMLRAAYLRLAAPARNGAAALEKMRVQLGLSADEMPEVAKEAALAQARLQGMGVSVFDSQGRMRSMIDILRDMAAALKGASDQEKLSAIKAIFGDRAASGAAAIFRHIETGRLDEVLEKIRNADGVAGEMAARMRNTAAGAFRRLSAATEGLGISVGSVLLPAFADMAQGAADAANRIGALAEKYPTLVKYIGLAVSGLVSLKVAAIALGYGFTFLKGGVLSALGAAAKLRAGFALLNARLLITKGITLGGMFAKFGASIWSLVSGAIPALIGAIKAVGLAVMANPVGLAIAAAAVAVALLAANWDKVRAAAGKAWDSIKSGAGAAWSFVKKTWEPAGEFFSGLWNGIVEGASAVWGKVGELVLSPIKAIKDTLGAAWDWLAGNGGERSVYGERPAPAPVASVDMTPLNARAGRTLAGNSSMSFATNATINVHPSSGMDERRLAEEVRLALAREERAAAARIRSANYDI